MSPNPNPYPNPYPNPNPNQAAEFAACGCALVGVRKVERGDAADERKAADYEARFPSFN